MLRTDSTVISAPSGISSTAVLRTAATLSESPLDDVALPLEGQTDESEAVIVVAVLSSEELNERWRRLPDQPIHV
jgi:hypothetical protein